MNVPLLLVHVALIISMVTANQSEEGLNKIRKAHNECESDSKTRADRNAVTKLLNYEEIERGALGPHAFCMATKLDLLAANGTINVHEIRNLLSFFIDDADELTEYTGKCAQTKTSPEDTAQHIFVCLYRFKPRRLQTTPKLENEKFL